MFTIANILLVILAVVVGVIALAAVVFLLTKLFGLVWVIFGNIFRFIGSEVRDVAKLIGAVVVIPIFSLLVLLNVVIGRWSASAHFGRNVGAEFRSIGASVYRIAVGNPARLLGLGGALQGVEERLPAAMAEAPGRDKPKGGKAGRYEGYNIIGSLPVGGSGARLYIAEPEVMKRAALERRGMMNVDRVVIKAFSQSDGSTLDQIVRESRALEAAKELGLVLEHSSEADRFYYVMRYVPGDSLGVVTHRLHATSPSDGLDAKSLRLVMGYAADLIDSLHTYHRGGLWHKDIKPDNIIIDPADDRAHLVDFGLVTPMRSAMTLTTHGTEYFRDPELVRQALRGVKVNEIDGAKFDVYSAGAVMFSVIENSFPAHGGLSQITKKCPDALKWVVRRAMADYQRRYTSAAEMRADLDVVLHAANPFAVRPAELPSMKGDAAGTNGVESSIGSPSFEMVWATVGHLAGQTFKTKTGIEFAYEFDGKRVTPDRTDYPLSKADFVKAHALMPLEGPGEINNLVRGPAYIWAILNDHRVRDNSPEPVPHMRPRQAAQAFAGGAAAAAGGVGGAAASVGPMGAAAAAGPKRAPRLRVSDWWSGKYTAEAGAAPASQSPLTDTPFENAGVKAKAAWEKASAKVRGEPVKAEHRGTPAARVVPIEHRAPAADQLKNARDRVRATRAKARQRVSGRVANARRARKPSAMGGTKGLVFGLFLALGVFFTMALVVGALLAPLTRSETRINSSGGTASAWVAGDNLVTINTDGFPTISIAPNVAPNVEDYLAQMPSLEERVLVLSDLTSPLDDQVKALLNRAFGLLAESGAELTGDLVTSLDDADTDLLDLLARVRTDRGALPLDSTELGGRLKGILGDIASDYDGVLWISPVKGEPEAVEYFLIGADGVISSQADDLDDVVRLADQIDDLD
ncbi:MAG: serine/threonine protein kinase [Phycisphaerales bacterium]|jgi:serine/threonine protein kinase